MSPRAGINKIIDVNSRRADFTWIVDVILVFVEVMSLPKRHENHSLLTSEGFDDRPSIPFVEFLLIEDNLEPDLQDGF
jgi:hypothetical protein